MKILISLLMLVLCTFSQAKAQSDTVSGLYYAILYHDNGDYFQSAKLTLRTVNSNGVMKISVNAKIFLEESDSTEFLTYDFDDVPLNLITRQINIGNAENDVSMIGYLRDGSISGEWFSSTIGKIGSFQAKKTSYPDVEEGRIHVKALSGHYKGSLKNTSADSNLPERVAISFVTTPDRADGRATLKVTGNMRFYLGPFGSQEYVEVAFEEVQYNVFNRFFSAKSPEYGLTIKGVVANDGHISGKVFSNGLGEVATVTVDKDKN